MHVISIRVPDPLFIQTQSSCEMLHMTQTEYVRTALAEKNEKIEAQQRRQTLQSASLKVREESMKINAEFSAIEKDPHA